MKKVIFILIVLFFISCFRKELSVYDLQQNALNTGVHNDTIFGSLVFNCTDSVVYRSLGITTGDKYNFPIKELESYLFIVTPHFFNDSLYEIEFDLPDDYYRFSEILNVYKLKYDSPDTVFKSSLNNADYEEAYWFKHNLQIKITSRKSDIINGLSILYTDLSRKINGPGIVSDDVNYFNFWTDKYYNDVYLPKKKKNLKGI